MSFIGLVLVHDIKLFYRTDKIIVTQSSVHGNAFRNLDSVLVYGCTITSVTRVIKLPLTFRNYHCVELICKSVNGQAVRIGVCVQL